MSTVYSVPPELVAKFKEPFGILIPGASVETMSKLERMVKTENPSLIVSVGDIVTRNLHAHGINPKLSVTDNKCGRKRIPAATYPVDRVVRVKNPRGMITEDAITAIKEELKRGRQTHIIVDGEEDLLTLIAVLYAPEKSFVVYGQPNKGVVVVKVTSEKKAEAAEILKAMKTVRKAK